jgi:hypothetical protein
MIALFTIAPIAYAIHNAARPCPEVALPFSEIKPSHKYIRQGTASAVPKKGRVFRGFNP